MMMVGMIVGLVILAGSSIMTARQNAEHRTGLLLGQRSLNAEAREGIAILEDFVRTTPGDREVISAREELGRGVPGCARGRQNLAAALAQLWTSLLEQQRFAEAVRLNPGSEEARDNLERAAGLSRTSPAPTR